MSRFMRFTKIMFLYTKLFKYVTAIKQTIGVYDVTGRVVDKQFICNLRWYWITNDFKKPGTKIIMVKKPDIIAPW